VPTVERRAHEAGLGAATAQLGQDAFNQAWAEDHATPLADAVAEALNAPTPESAPRPLRRLTS
jgi:hypothetical protein